LLADQFAPLSKEFFSKYRDNKEVTIGPFADYSYEDYLKEYNELSSLGEKVKKSLERLNQELDRVAGRENNPLKDLLSRHPKYTVMTRSLPEHLVGQVNIDSKVDIVFLNADILETHEKRDDFDWYVAYYYIHEVLHLDWADRDVVKAKDEVFIHNETLEIVKQLKYLDQKDYNRKRFVTDLAINELNTEHGQRASEFWYWGYDRSALSCAYKRYHR